MELLWKENQGRRKKQRHQIIYLGEHVNLHENVKESPVLTTITSPFGDFLKAYTYILFYKEEEQWSPWYRD